jgi:hypothetical protein
MSSLLEFEMVNKQTNWDIALAFLPIALSLAIFVGFIALQYRFVECGDSCVGVPPHLYKPLRGSQEYLESSTESRDVNEARLRLTTLKNAINNLIPKLTNNPKTDICITARQTGVSNSSTSNQIFLSNMNEKILALNEYIKADYIDENMNQNPETKVMKSRIDTIFEIINKVDSLSNLVIENCSFSTTGSQYAQLEQKTISELLSFRSSLQDLELICEAGSGFYRSQAQRVFQCQSVRFK